MWVKIQRTIKHIVMKHIKCIMKVVLFYTTFLFTILILMGIDSIDEQGLLLEFISIEILLLIVCKYSLTIQDIELLTFSKYIKDEQ